MSKNTVIKWQPVTPEGETLTDSDADMIVMELQQAFPDAPWPIRLTYKDIPKVEGMAAASRMIGNPYLVLLGHLKRYKVVHVWPEFGEGAF